MCVGVCLCVCAFLRECDVLCVCINVWHLLVQTKREAQTLVSFEFDPWASFYNVFYIFT